jgi:hypothetical protein
MIASGSGNLPPFVLAIACDSDDGIQHGVRDGGSDERAL